MYYCMSSYFPPVLFVIILSGKTPHLLPNAPPPSPPPAESVSYFFLAILLVVSRGPQDLCPNNYISSFSVGGSKPLAAVHSNHIRLAYQSNISGTALT